MWTGRTALALLLLVLVAAPVASAAGPRPLVPRAVTVASDGQAPAIAVDVNGDAHVVFAASRGVAAPFAPGQVGYCRVRAGARACDQAAVLALPGEALSPRAAIVARADGLLSVVAIARDASLGGLYLTTSRDGGASWSVPARVLDQTAAAFPATLEARQRTDGRIGVLLLGDFPRYTEVDPDAATATAPFTPDVDPYYAGLVAGGASAGVVSTPTGANQVGIRARLPGVDPATEAGWAPWTPLLDLSSAPGALQAVAGAPNGDVDVVAVPPGDAFLRLVHVAGGARTGPAPPVAGARAQVRARLVADGASATHVALTTEESYEGCSADRCLVYRYGTARAAQLGAFAVVATSTQARRLQEAVVSGNMSGRAWLAWELADDPSGTPIVVAPACVRAAPLCTPDQDAVPGGTISLTGPAGFVVTRRHTFGGKPDPLRVAVRGPGVASVRFRLTVARSPEGSGRTVTVRDARAPFTATFGLAPLVGRSYLTTACATQVAYTLEATVTLARRAGTRALTRQIAYCPLDRR